MYHGTTRYLLITTRRLGMACIACLFIPLHASAQVKTPSPGITVELGKPYPVVDAASKYYFPAGDGVLSVKVDRDVITIMRMDGNTLSMRSMKEYRDIPKDAVIEHLGIYADRYYLFYSLWDGVSGREQLFHREMDAEAGRFIGNGELILSVSGKVTGSLTSTGFYQISVTDKFSFDHSGDERTLLVKYRKKPELRDDSKSHDIIGLAVFTAGMEKQWSNEFRMPYTEEKMDIWSYAVDGEGYAYFLAKVREGSGDEETRGRGKHELPNYHGEVFRVGPASTEFDITPIEMDGRFVSSVWLFEGVGDDMIGGGAFNLGGDRNDTDGFFTFSVGKSGGLRNMVFHEIPIEILNQYTSEKAQRKNEKKEKEDEATFQGLTLRKVIVEPSGDRLVIFEQYYVVYHTYTMNGRTTSYYTYHYNDFLVARLNVQGDLAWMNKLPKRQTGRSGKGGMSFEHFTRGDEHYLVFLDHEENMTVDENRFPATHSDGQGGFLTAYKINGLTGEFDKLSIMDTRDVRGMELFQVGVNRVVAVSANEFLMEAYKKKKEDILVRVVLGE